MVSACSVDTYSSDLRSFPDFGCFGRGRRTPSSQGNGSHRSFFSLPPFASAFRSSRPQAEHSYSHNQNQSQAERRNEYNDPLNDPSSTWSNYSTMGQQSAFANDDDPRLQYSYPAPQQPPQPYQSYRDPSTSYSNHPTTLPPINVTANHPRDERWQQNPYGGTSATSRVPDTVFSPVASYPGQSFSYPTQNPPQVMLPDPRYSVPINPPTPSSTAATRRGPVSVERTATRSSAHTASTSPYSRHPPASNISPDHPPPKKKRKRADAEQLRVLNEVYARTAFPSTEERQELAARLNMTPRSVQIWYQNKRQSMRNTHRQSASIRGTGSDNPPGAHHGASSRTAAIPSTVSTVPMPSHHSGSSRTAPIQSNLPTVPMPPHRPSSVSGNPQQATYIPPSPTDPTYFSLSRTSQPQQGTSGQYRSPSRNREDYDDYYDGGGTKRSRV